jgi:hypothetical protein
VLERERLKLLRRHPWRFARVEAALAGEDDDTSNEWSKSYDYPTDCARALYISDGLRVDSHTVPSPPIPFQESSIDGDEKRIFTDEDDAVLVYTKYVTDTTVYTAEFDDALALALALAALPRLSKGDPYGKRTELLQMFYESLSLACAVDLMAATQDDPPDPEEIAGR